MAAPACQAAFGGRTVGACPGDESSCLLLAWALLWLVIPPQASSELTVTL